VKLRTGFMWLQAWFSSELLWRR